MRRHKMKFPTVKPPIYLTRRRKTKFPTVKPPIYLPKCQFESSYPLNKDKTNARYETTDAQQRSATEEWSCNGQSEKYSGA